MNKVGSHFGYMPALVYINQSPAPSATAGKLTDEFISSSNIRFGEAVTSITADSIDRVITSRPDIQELCGSGKSKVEKANWDKIIDPEQSGGYLPDAESLSELLNGGMLPSVRGRKRAAAGFLPSPSEYATWLRQAVEQGRPDLAAILVASVHPHVQNEPTYYRSSIYDNDTLLAVVQMPSDAWPVGRPRKQEALKACFVEILLDAGINPYMQDAQERDALDRALQESGLVRQYKRLHSQWSDEDCLARLRGELMGPEEVLNRLERELHAPAYVKALVTGCKQWEAARNYLVEEKGIKRPSPHLIMSEVTRLRQWGN